MDNVNICYESPSYKLLSTEPQNLVNVKSYFQAPHSYGVWGFSMNMNGISLLSQTSGSNLLGFSNTPTIHIIKVGAFFFKPKGQSRDKFCWI